MRRHGPVIAHCADSEDFPDWLLLQLSRGHSDGHRLRPMFIHYFIFRAVRQLNRLAVVSCEMS